MLYPGITHAFLLRGNQNACVRHTETRDQGCTDFSSVAHCTGELPARGELTPSLPQLWGGLTSLTATSLQICSCRLLCNAILGAAGGAKVWGVQTRFWHQKSQPPQNDQHTAAGNSH